MHHRMRQKGKYWAGPLPEAYTPYEDVVDTMLDNILDSMECKNCNICDHSYSICVQGNNMDDETCSLSDAIEQNTIP